MCKFFSTVHSRRALICLACVLPSLIMSGADAADVVSTWDGSTGNWSDATRWNSLDFPDNGNAGQTYDAIVTGGFVTLDQGIAIDRLALAGGVITGPSSLQALTGLDWTGGTISSTNPLTAAGGSLAGTTKVLEGTLRLTDDADWTTGVVTFSALAGQIELRNGATFTDGGGISKSLAAHLDVDAGTTYTKVGSGTTTHGQFGTTLNNRGSVEVNAGRLDLFGDGVGTGGFVVDAQLRLVSGTHNYAGPFAGLGELRMAGGSASLSGGYAVSNTAVTNGALSFTSAGLTNTGATTISGGALASDAGLTIPTLNWTGGSLRGTGATSVSAGTFGGSTKLLETRLRVDGTADWAQGTITFSTSAGEIEILNGATLTDSGVQNRTLAADLFVRSGGTYTHSNTGRTTHGSFGTTLTNDGNIDVPAGALDLLGDGFGGGDFDVTGQLDFSSGTHVYTGSMTGTGLTTFSGANVMIGGSYQVANTNITAGTAAFSAGAAADLGNVSISGGTLSAADSVVIPQLNWTGGGLRGSGTATITSGTLSGSTKTLEQRLQIAGDTNWNVGTITFSTAPGTIEVLPTATMTDSGSSNRSLAAHLEIHAGGTYAHTNTGTTTQGQFATTIANDGVITIASGVFDLLGDGAGVGDFDVDGTLDFSSGSHNYSGQIAGNGLVRFSGATAVVNGQFSPASTTVAGGNVTLNSATQINSGNTTLTSGTVRGTADLVIPQLVWTGGTLDRSGSTTVTNATLSGSTKFLQNTLSVEGDAEWSQGTITFSTSAGTLQLLSGATFTDSGNTNRALAADLLIGNDAIYRHTGTGTTTQGQFGTRLTNMGTLQVADGTFVADGPFTNFDAGTATLTGGIYEVSGTLRFRDADVDINEASILLDGPASMIVDQAGLNALANLSVNESGAQLSVFGGRDFSSASGITNRGAIRLGDGAMFSSDALSNEPGGLLAGMGTFAPTNGTLSNGGSVSPAGTLVVDADYHQQPAGQLVLAIDGTSGADLLIVTGSATLGGIIDVSFDGGFTPQAGDSIELLSAAGGVIGVFATELIPAVANVEFELRYEAASVLLEAFHQVDFDRDGNVDGDDIDALVAEIVAQTNGALFDLSGDGIVDDADLANWLASAGAINLPSQSPYLVGDANLDGNVDGQDFVIWNANKFSSASAWTLGDFTANGVVDGADFVAWNANKFQAADFASVPEPAMSVWMLLAALWSRVAREPKRR